MQLFGPNVLVVGDTLFAGTDDPVGKPNAPSAAAQYEREIIQMRDQIGTTPFGAAWLEIVANNREPITIVPSSDTSNAVAQTFPNDPVKPNRSADALASGVSVDGVSGSGRGTPIRVKFNTQASAGAGLNQARGAVLLVHEMTHAYRSASGRYNPIPMDGLVDPQRLRANPDIKRRFPDFEELLAIVVEDVFAADQGGKILRTNWDILFPSFATDPAYFKFWGISEPPGGTDSENFAAEYRPAMRRIREVEKPLADAMLASRAWFNPLRDYIESLFASRT
jgi:hypothetical protein